MEDKEIVELYWQRKELAIQATAVKYERYLQKIAYNILFDLEDSKESVNDTYLRAWNAMPPHQPVMLSSFLGKITRQLSIDRFRKANSQKRKPSEYVLSLSELEECVTNGDTTEQGIELHLLTGAINRYLHTLSEETRDMFVCRYFFMDSIREIAVYHGAGEEKIKSSLYRARKGLRTYLEEEGFVI